ncbi:short chain dehydrogenase [Nesidiocoris tenuis]|uniref:Short chain dehydrogenase n=1 Tax=Nesidiocoris tenuis TaxID=355587 RepID=A0ABN7AEN0_9HEMI|nr:short chain dehydrogenase [Nesidiocoris tenuis]
MSNSRIATAALHPYSGDYVLFEIKYYFLGAGAIFDDVKNKKSNVCPLRNLAKTTAIVTGGSRGIGAALVAKLLQCEMHVIIACRNVDAGQRKLEEIRNMGITTGTANVYELDLMSFASIKKFASEVKKKFRAIHLLVHNAGIMFAPYRESEDGFESHWQVNHLGPALLTHLLLPIIEPSTKNERNFTPRIVSVTSCAHAAARQINFENISMKDHYIPSAAYAQSKLAQLLFAINLGKRLERASSKVQVHCVHPGIVNTDLFDGTLLKKTMPWVLTRICKTAEKGAVSVLHACISPQLDDKTGTYSSNCRIVEPGRNARSRHLRHRIFNKTLENLGLEHFGHLDAGWIVDD